VRQSRPPSLGRAPVNVFGGTGTNLILPTGIAFDATGNLYLANFDTSAVNRVDKIQK